MIWEYYGRRMDPIFMAPPSAIFEAAVQLIQSGALKKAMVSMCGGSGGSLHVRIALTARGPRWRGHETEARCTRTAKPSFDSGVPTASPPPVHPSTALAVTLWTGEQAGSTARLLVGSGTSQQVELWDVRMLAGDGYASEGHPSGTRELLLVIEGELTLELDGDPHLVCAGDAIAFVADRPHAYRNQGTSPLRYALSVIHRDQPARPVPMPPA